MAALSAVLAWGGWQWQARDARQQARLAESSQRLAALEQRLDALRRDQRAQRQRLQHADATNRVLRDELLAIGQRAALLEDSVERLAAAGGGAQALRLDEVELLLSTGLQRVQIAGDIEGARRAYALAGELIDGTADPTLVSLRQTLAQERGALEAVAVEPRTRALAELALLAEALAAAPPPAPATEPRRHRPWWQRAFDRIVEVRPSGQAPIAAPAERASAGAALQLELSLARAAAERRDAVAYRAALTRAQAWLERLWPASPARARNLAQLRALAATGLSPVLPTLGSTLLQLRQLRAPR